MRSRNAAIKQSLSQNTANLGHQNGVDMVGQGAVQGPAGARPTGGLGFGPGGYGLRRNGPAGMPAQYQNMLIGDQSLAQLTQFTQNSNSNQDDASLKNLTDTLNDLNINSNTNSNTQIGFGPHGQQNCQNLSEKMKNLSVSHKRRPNGLFTGAAPQGLQPLGLQQHTPYEPSSQLLPNQQLPYENQENPQSQMELQQINQIMNLNKGHQSRNQITRMHNTHQQTSQVQMKNANIGLTDNPSSAGDHSSSLLTIGLPSVVSQGGGPTHLQVHGPITQAASQQAQSSITLNMNMNFNITNPAIALDTNHQGNMPSDHLLNQLQDHSNTVKRLHAAQQQQHLPKHSRNQKYQHRSNQQIENIDEQASRNGASIDKNSNQDSKSYTSGGGHANSQKIQQLVNAQRSNQNSLKSLNRTQPQMEQLPAGSNQIQSIKDNLKKLKFQEGGHAKRGASKESIIKSSEEMEVQPPRALSQEGAHHANRTSAAHKAGNGVHRKSTTKLNGINTNNGNFSGLQNGGQNNQRRLIPQKVKNGSNQSMLVPHNMGQQSDALQILLSKKNFRAQQKSQAAIGQAQSQKSHSQQPQNATNQINQLTAQYQKSNVRRGPLIENACLKTINLQNMNSTLQQKIDASHANSAENLRQTVKGAQKFTTEIAQGSSKGNSSGASLPNTRKDFSRNVQQKIQVSNVSQQSQLSSLSHLSLKSRRQLQQQHIKQRCNKQQIQGQSQQATAYGQTTEKEEALQVDQPGSVTRNRRLEQEQLITIENQANADHGAQNQQDAGGEPIKNTDCNSGKKATSRNVAGNPRQLSQSSNTAQYFKQLQSHAQYQTSNQTGDNSKNSHSSMPSHQLNQILIKQIQQQQLIQLHHHLKQKSSVPIRLENISRVPNEGTKESNNTKSNKASIIINGNAVNLVGSSSHASKPSQLSQISQIPSHKSQISDYLNLKQIQLQRNLNQQSQKKKEQTRSIPDASEQAQVPKAIEDEAQNQENRSGEEQQSYGLGEARTRQAHDQDQNEASLQHFVGQQQYQYCDNDISAGSFQSSSQLSQANERHDKNASTQNGSQYRASINQNPVDASGQNKAILLNLNQTKAVSHFSPYKNTSTSKKRKDHQSPQQFQGIEIKENRAGASSSGFGAALAPAAASGAGALGPGARGSPALISPDSQQPCETLSKKTQSKVPQQKHQFKSMNPYDLNVEKSNQMRRQSRGRNQQLACSGYQSSQKSGPSCQLPEGNVYGGRSTSIQNLDQDQDFDSDEKQRYNKKKQEDLNGMRQAHAATTQQNTQNNTHITQYTHTGSKSRQNNLDLGQNSHEFTFDQTNNTNAGDANTIAINRPNHSQHDSALLSKQSKQSTKTRKTYKDVSSGKLSNQGHLFGDSTVVRKYADQQSNLMESDGRRDFVGRNESEVLNMFDQFQANMGGLNVQPGYQMGGQSVELLSGEQSCLDLGSDHKESRSGSQQIQMLQNQTSAMRVKQREDLQPAQGSYKNINILNFNCDGNSFDEESSSRLEHEEGDDGGPDGQNGDHPDEPFGGRLEALESQQFDTKLELLEQEQESGSQLRAAHAPQNRHDVAHTYQTQQSNMRFDCEGTEIELNQEEDEGDENDSEQEIENNYAPQAFQYNDTTEQSQVLFDQRSMRNEFVDSQVRLSDQGAREAEHHNQKAYDSPLVRHMRDSGCGGIGLNQFEERDQMQTAIVLPSGSGSGQSRDSNEQSSTLTANEHEYPDHEQSSSVRRETPAFKKKHKQREPSAKVTDIRGGTASSGEQDGEQERLRTMIVGRTQQSGSSHQEQSRRSRRSQQSQLSKHAIVDNQGTQNFENQFGITQTVERLLPNPSELEATNYDKNAHQALISQLDCKRSKFRDPSHQNEPHLQPASSASVQQQRLPRRNPRFQNQSRTIAVSRAFHNENEMKTEHKSLEQRLREEELLNEDELLQSNQKNSQFGLTNAGQNQYSNDKNALLESNQTIVSKQRVRQVPVSNTPKRLRNISTGKKSRMKSGESRKSQANGQRERQGNQSSPDSKKNLSMKQDSARKNVYHIFGRQTSESFASVQDNPKNHQSELIEPATSGQPTTGGPVTLNGHGAGHPLAISVSQRKHRKLLFALSQQEYSSLNQNYDDNCSSSLKAKQRLQIDQAVRSFGQQQKQKSVNSYKIPTTSGQKRQMVEDVQDQKGDKMFDGQYRTVDALPRRRLHQGQQQVSKQHQIHNEYGSNHRERQEQQPPSDQVNWEESQVDGVSGLLDIDSDEEHYGQNQNHHYENHQRLANLNKSDKQESLNVQQHRQGARARRKLISSSQMKQSKLQKSHQCLKAHEMMEYNQTSTALLDMADINQGVTYDKNGRGRKTIMLGDTEENHERLIYDCKNAQSKTISPQDPKARRMHQDPSHRDLSSQQCRRDPQRQYCSLMQDNSTHCQQAHQQKSGSQVWEMPTTASKGRNQAARGQAAVANAYGELDHKIMSTGQQHQGTASAKRMKKPKDIYALKNQISHKRAKNHQVKQLQLVNCNKRDQVDLANSASRPGGRGRDRYHPAYEGFDERQEAEYQMEGVPKSQLHQTSDPNMGRRVERSSSRTSGALSQQLVSNFAAITSTTYKDHMRRPADNQQLFSASNASAVNVYQSLQPIQVKNKDSLMQSPLHKDVNVKNSRFQGGINGQDGQQVGQTSQEVIKEWMKSKNGGKLLKTRSMAGRDQGRLSRSLAQKSQVSFTRNRLNREANDSAEMLCQDNVVVLASPKPTQHRDRNARSQFPINRDQQGAEPPCQSMSVTRTLDQPQRMLERQEDQLFGESGLQQRQFRRGRLRQARGNGSKLKRLAMSEGPAHPHLSRGQGDQITYRSAEGASNQGENDSRSKSGGKNGRSSTLAAWCCLHSKSRAASCESGGGAKGADNSDNNSSGCSVF